MKRVIVFPALIVALALLAAAGLLATAPQLEPEAPAPIAPVVRIMIAEPQQVQLLVHSQGTVEPRTESALIPEVAGRVAWMSPSLVSGGVFRAGEVLIQIEDEDYHAAVEQARASFAQAEAEAANARFEYERRLSLQARNLVSRSDIEAAERRLKVAEAARDGAGSGLARAQRDLHRTRIAAPFAGMVRSKSVDVGQFLARGTAVATLYATDAVEVRLPLADEQLAFLNLPLGLGSELGADSAPVVTLQAVFAGQPLSWEGQVVRTEGEIDPRSRMVHVVAQVEPTAAPIPIGLFVTATIAGNRVDGIVTLPRSALRDGNRVLVVDADNRLWFRDVVPLRFYRDEVLISHGLVAGEQVCLSPIQTVVEGMNVQIAGA
ncbi:MAG: efflux RND transporter periplasmic adaptor subunit [Gammaproteobacteria bacterium]|nr:efflux RND transporter periplasmic adaptor subunit [Gammaproteobacteria bacterium]